MAVSIKKEEKEEGRKKEERSGLRVDATTFANATFDSTTAAAASTKLSKKREWFLGKK